MSIPYYSGYTEFSPNRKEVYLTLKDGGFGDADGIENGIIVDPLAFGSDSDPKSDSSDSSDSPIDELFGGIIPDDISCFIGTTAGELSKYNLNAVGLLHPGLVLGVILLFPYMTCTFKHFLSRLAKSANRGIQKKTSGRAAGRHPPLNFLQFFRRVNKTILN
ncbi:MAG: hypothetical protein KJP23_18315 [Deltaproteobacteria bacterium]|nr:hypothetical protein [Deltaproteobacteria bacterium]